MEIIKIQQQIEHKIKQLDTILKSVPGKIEARAKSMAEYDRELATTITKLKADDTPTTIAEKLAKGQCWALKLQMEEADMIYRATIDQLKAIRAQLNGYQSIFRHLEQV